MTGDKFKIAKGYKVFLAGASSEPMDEPTELQLYGWLCTRGYSEAEASRIIAQVDEQTEVNLVLP
ncbi:MAG: hypothetical protein WB919_21345 [Candidatus Sulfotelmatobacter sp.]